MLDPSSPTRSLRWVAAAGATGLIAGPMTDLAGTQIVPAPAADLATAVPMMVLAVTAIVVLFILWSVFANQARLRLSVSERHARLIAAVVLITGGTYWSLPTLPKGPGPALVYLPTGWLAMTVPYMLVALALCPALRAVYRIPAALAACSWAAGWSVLASFLLHRIG